MPTVSVKVSKCLADNHGASACVVDVQTATGICRADPDLHRAEHAKTHRGVIMVKGSWDKFGQWTDDGTRVTLSCDATGGVDQALSADGAITACIRGHRYAPGSYHDKFLACIRAVRADYCGDGKGHTTAGTDIDVFDSTLNQMTTADCSDGRASEASWTPAGAACIAHLRWTNSPNIPSLCTNVNFGPPNNGVRCLTSAPTPILTTRSIGHTCSGGNEVDVPSPETDAVCPH